MVARFFSLKHTSDEIAITSKYESRKGMSNQDIVHTLKKLGLKTREKTNSSWGDLKLANKNKDKIIIVSWMKNGYVGHFSVIQEIDENRIIIADPESGKNEKIDKIIFMRLWMDYDDMWYPKKNTDIQLRWMCIVSKK